MFLLRRAFGTRQHILLLLLLLLLITTYVTFTTAVAKDFVCHDPDVGGTLQNLDRRFLVIGSDDSEGAGLGNLLIFFPAAYYFAAFTGRDLIISDRSTIGEMCKVIICGFPFASDMANAYPGILGGDRVRDAPLVKKQDFMAHIEGGREINANVVRAFGYQSLSDWWVYFNATVHCVAKITGCAL